MRGVGRVTYPQSFILSGVGRVEFSHANTASTLALGLNQAGDIVGWYPFGTDGARAFLRRHDGVMAEVDVFGANVTKALGINEAGTIVGLTGPGTHGFVLVQSQ